MTVKRDFKRRVRQRQARTGESYVTARRHLLASRPEAAPGEAAPGEAEAAPGEPEAAPGETGIPVVELIDVTGEAKRFGLLCPVRMFPSLARRIEPARVLGRLRDLLIATVGDPATAVLAGLALAGQQPAPRKPSTSFEELGRFLQRARAGLGGTFDDGTTLAFHVADRDGFIPILCTLSAQNTAIELSAVGDLMPERWEALARMLDRSRSRSPATTLGPTRIGHSFAMLLEAMSSSLSSSMSSSGPTLFVIHQGRRTAITGDEFIIGRGPTTADLAIKDGLVSRKHAAVIRRNGAHYIWDLGSTHGILYKGVRINNKRIAEGDVFQIGEHEISFTFQEH